jgi:hypothetical protein
LSWFARLPPNDGILFRGIGGRIRIEAKGEAKASKNLKIEKLTV